MPEPTTEPYALVVDDSAFIVMNAVDILEQGGFRCLEANSGDEAKAVLDEHHAEITLLFSDIEMPGSTNGVALAWYAAERWPDIEIVLASGRYQPKDGELPDKATFIPKPFSVDVVHDHLAAKLPDGKKPEPLRQAV